MKKMNKTAAITIALSMFGVGLAIPQVAAAQVTAQQEAAAYPRIAKAIHDTEAALRLLEAAPDDFGGNKARAAADMRTAIHSMRRALFYRVHLDDAAIDRAQF